MFRFIDDLHAVNNHLEFGRNFKNIFPLELQFKEKNIPILKASYLDLSIYNSK